MPCPRMEAGKQCEDCEEVAYSPNPPCDERVGEYYASLIDAEIVEYLDERMKSRVRGKIRITKKEVNKNESKRIKNR